jgi:DnaK suppressor protein
LPPTGLAHIFRAQNSLMMKIRVAGEEYLMSSNMLSPDYTPTDKEGFMNPMMQEFFRQRLTAWREDLLRESGVTLQTMQTTSVQEPDIADRASQESERTLELRTRDRERKLISKIDAALRRIEAGEYGYCEDTGEPIGVGRLIARPIATMSIEAQERHERMEKTHRDE